MSRIETYVFFDIETTGLPKEEKNHTKITELCFIVVSRNDIEITKYGDIPPVSKLCLLFNPEREVNPTAAHITGLTKEYLKNCSTFSQKVDTINTFLGDLKKPICLIAHNGNSFDFKILLMEFENAKRSLPKDLLCVDSLVGIRKLLKGTQINYKELSSHGDDGIITDDEEDSWPALNISNKDWNDIDSLSTSLSGMAFENAKTSSPIREEFNLAAVYKRLLNKEISNAHRAEADCLMLVESVVAIKHLFLPWADLHSKNLTEIKPYKPY
ncbi:three prime repair exonuclease 2-like [Achroia grisella]|uniref:three prime repair exonuclease 2-like n=1 Tax=Achroia grisella TaxID=688607 RepID=UPI0027D278F5|nr:three prime repair exonuclease 2-like [Achroia grisella]